MDNAFYDRRMCNCNWLGSYLMLQKTRHNIPHELGTLRWLSRSCSSLVCLIAQALRLIQTERRVYASANLATIASDRGVYANTRVLLIGTLETIFSETLIEIHLFPFKKMYLKMSSLYMSVIFSWLQCVMDYLTCTEEILTVASVPVKRPREYRRT